MMEDATPLLGSRLAMNLLARKCPPTVPLKIRMYPVINVKRLLDHWFATILFCLQGHTDHSWVAMCTKHSVLFVGTYGSFMSSNVYQAEFIPPKYRAISTNILLTGKILLKVNVIKWAWTLGTHFFYRQLGYLAFSLRFWPKIKQFLSNCPAS